MCAVDVAFVVSTRLLGFILLAAKLVVDGAYVSRLGIFLAYERQSERASIFSEAFGGALALDGCECFQASVGDLD